MIPLSKKEKLAIINRIFWDVEIDAEKILCLLEGKIQRIPGIGKTQVYRRLLSSCHWYTILKIMPPEQMTKLLDDSVLDTLFPKELQERYSDARSILLQ